MPEVLFSGQDDISQMIQHLLSVFLFMALRDTKTKSDRACLLGTYYLVRETNISMDNHNTRHSVWGSERLIKTLKVEKISRDRSQGTQA